jgi:AcrR family transcriptional regulator
MMAPAPQANENPTRVADPNGIAIPAATTRERILSGAALLFSEHGYAQGSIRNITSTCGIKGASFYHHFRSKEEMTAALLRMAAALTQEELDKVSLATFAGDPRGLLEAAIDAHLRAYFHPNRMLAALVQIYRQLPPDLFLITREALRPIRNRWVEIVEVSRGSPFSGPDDAKAITLILFGGMNAMADWQERPGFAMPLPAVRKLFADMVFRGLRGE